MSTEPGPGPDDAVVREALAFSRGYQSLLMATTDGDGHPHISYAVHVTDADGVLYVYISSLATHTQNLVKRPVVSVMFIEDESQATNPFARKRLTINCGAELIPRDTPAWEEILARFAQRHGGIVGVLKGLPDFQLFRLVPSGGVYVRGFGQAFTLAAAQFQGADSAS